MCGRCGWSANETSVLLLVRSVRRVLLRRVALLAHRPRNFEAGEIWKPGFGLNAFGKRVKEVCLQQSVQG